MPTLVDALAMLELESTAENQWSAAHLDSGHGVVFGGQLLAQSLVAATLAVPGKEVLSLQHVFARGASPAEPLAVAAEVLHAGRAFASVTVTTAQGERRCSRSEVLLHEPGPDLIRHGEAMPEVPGPDELPARPHGEASLPAPEGRPSLPAPEGRQFWEIRIVDDVDIGDPDAIGPPELRVWTRFPGAPDDATVSQALLAYASDGFLIGAAMRPHAGVGQSMAHVSISTTVLTQSLTFHEPFAAGDWLLLDHRSTYAGRGRSRGEARVFTADGRLVASFGQDNMIRDFPQGQAPAAGERARF